MKLARASVIRQKWVWDGPVRVAVVGAGMAGAACAVELRAAGMDVDVVDRGRAPGGRLASPEVHGRRVDLGAAYFTARDADFVALARRWREQGLAREWTDRFEVIGPDGRSAAEGTTRWAAPGGLRSLVRDILPAGVVTSDRSVESLDELDHDAIVLAMPDPQAARLAPDAVEWVEYEPVIAVALGYPRRTWRLSDAAFVNDDPDVTLIADDGARRGDAAPVLVAHTTADLARAHLDDPAAVVPTVVAAVARLLEVADAPLWTHPHRWTFAKPTGSHDEPFGLTEYGGRTVGVCGDSWSPSGPPRVESAWLSGTRLGRALAASNG